MHYPDARLSRTTMDISASLADCVAAVPDAEPDRTPPRPIRDLYYFRVVTTGLSFLFFGLFGTLLGIVVVPLLLMLPGGNLARQTRVRHMIRLAFRALVGFMNQTGCISYTFAGLDSLGRRGQLVIANHPSLIDIVLLIAFVPGAACVVKRAAWRNPSMVVAVGAAGYVPNSPTDEMIERASALLTAGECLIMFPEGTRTVPLQPAHFHRGAASVAVRAARTVTPGRHPGTAAPPFEGRAVVQGARDSSALLVAGRARYRSRPVPRHTTADCLADAE